jgi:N-glycosylase/DNA lyase
MERGMRGGDLVAGGGAAPEPPSFPPPPDPLECLISFILSSNNGIARITSLVQKLCVTYGDELLPAKARSLAFAASAPPSTGVLPHAHADAYHAFPTLDQLAAADEDALRGMGLGYRARYVTGTVAALRSKPGGGAAWLASLRDEPSYPAVAAALTELPGVGPKVAACAALFSLDARGAVPVDTHVWQLAVKHYTPALKGKSLTPALAEKVVDALVGVFGEYAGWAHNALFIAELPAAKAALRALEQKEGAGSEEESGRGSESGSESSEAAAGGEWAPDTPAGKRARRAV